MSASFFLVGANPFTTRLLLMPFYGDLKSRVCWYLALTFACKNHSRRNKLAFLLQSSSTSNGDAQDCQRDFRLSALLQEKRGWQTYFGDKVTFLLTFLFSNFESWSELEILYRTRLLWPLCTYTEFVPQKVHLPTCTQSHAPIKWNFKFKLRTWENARHLFQYMEHVPIILRSLEQDLLQPIQFVEYMPKSRVESHPFSLFRCSWVAEAIHCSELISMPISCQHTKRANQIHPTFEMVQLKWKWQLA